MHCDFHTASALNFQFNCVWCREWEGAALRNSGTRCNNLLPVAGPAVPEAAYAAAAATFWGNLPASSVARSRQPGLCLPV